LILIVDIVVSIHINNRPYDKRLCEDDGALGIADFRPNIAAVWGQLGE
jgi:hypothetical protein